MDPFVQRLLQKAEERSRALGINNTAKSYDTQSGLTDNAAASELMLQQPEQTKNLFTHSASNTGSSSGSTKLQVVEKPTLSPACMHSPNKVLRQFSAMDKENMEVGIEINIMTDKNMEVEVQVEEKDITDSETSNDNSCFNKPQKIVNEPLARIRDTSRNRLQRLGALYSNNDLSSPIHRTEAKFHAESSPEDAGQDASPKKNQSKQRLGKLAALANTINQWEEDLTHHTPAAVRAVAPPKPDLPSRPVAAKKAPAPAPPTSKQQTPTKSPKKQQQEAPKQLKWDQKVINSLEAQGFQRRESSTVKYAYDYKQLSTQTEQADEGEQMETELPTSSTKAAVQKLAQNFGNTKMNEQKKPETNCRQGLVSKRAAVFETATQQHAQQQQQQQKDPTELSLKERRLLFERNKGEALMPKAAFGMAPPINKIRQEVTAALKKDEAHRANTNNVNTSAAVVNAQADSKVRDKVAALVANVQNSEQKVINEMQKQRQQEMDQLSNRFNKQKEVFNNQKCSIKTVRAPPPPPPLPTSNDSIKRRSPGNCIDVVDDSSKRAKKAEHGSNRLYPALSDMEQTDDDAHENCTPTTISLHNSHDEREALHGKRACTEHASDDEDEDSNESYMEDDEDSSAGLRNVSLGREIMQVVKKHDNKNHKQQAAQQQQAIRRPIKEVRYSEHNRYYDDESSLNGSCENSSLNSSENSAEISDLINEALDDDETTNDEEQDPNASIRSHGTTASKSFSFRNKYPTIAEESQTSNQSPKNNGMLVAPVTSELTVNEHQDENMVTLVHTVSFYRRQQNTNSASSTPVRRVIREEKVSRPLGMKNLEQMEYQQSSSSTDTHADNDDEQLNDENDDKNEQMVQAKIRKLLDEVCKQQTIISQTSQALNLCAATIEFSGSTESVEGERHLLVATHRRQACLDEVQRLRVEKSLRPDGVTREKGRLTVREITIPLRQDYIRKLATDTISGHHLVCLLKYNEHVLATGTVPTLPGLLAVKFPDVLTLNNVYADFRITLEIYGMTAQREILPHEVKYHINLPKKSGIKTPKKKQAGNRLVMPPVQSPAGPQAVRTPALVQYGFAIFSLREIQRNSWTLTQVREISPLEGIVHMKVNCELTVSVEHRGFLTMFEDISGFGAWHRRWCHLNGSVLNYWKYPDDEKKKTPLGTIDLYTCSTQKVTTAPRDICARLNTMLVECQRPALDTDKESLIIVPNGRTTIVRHLWSADTKDERDEWCAHLNKALTLLRAWGPPQ